MCVCAFNMCTFFRRQTFSILFLFLPRIHFHSLFLSDSILFSTLFYFLQIMASYLNASMVEDNKNKRQLTWLDLITISIRMTHENSPKTRKIKALIFSARKLFLSVNAPLSLKNRWNGCMPLLMPILPITFNPPCNCCSFYRSILIFIKIVHFILFEWLESSFSFHILQNPSSLTQILTLNW